MISERPVSKMMTAASMRMPSRPPVIRVLELGGQIGEGFHRL